MPGLAQTVVLTRLPGRASAMPPGEALAAYAATGATLALHLSAALLSQALAVLIPQYGGDCPAALVVRATWPEERVIRGTLATLDARRRGAHGAAAGGTGVGPGRVPRQRAVQPGLRPALPRVMPGAVPGWLVAAPRSGGGKTTVTLGLVAALRRRGIRVRTAKCGPDYIDPAFHAAASGAPGVNLDSWAMPPALLDGLFAAAAADADFLVVESAMGLFDGVAGPAGRTGSAADLAARWGLPVLLVLDVSGPGANRRRRGPRDGQLPSGGAGGRRGAEPRRQREAPPRRGRGDAAAGAGRGAAGCVADAAGAPSRPGAGVGAPGIGGAVGAVGGHGGAMLGFGSDFGATLTLPSPRRRGFATPSPSGRGPG